CPLRRPPWVSLLSLLDALPIWPYEVTFVEVQDLFEVSGHVQAEREAVIQNLARADLVGGHPPGGAETELHLVAVFVRFGCYDRRSEEHTSELQSRENLVCRLLL